MASNSTGTEIMRAKSSRRDPPVLGIWAVGSIILIWLILLPRVIPDTANDRGIFVSVAERLLAGDVLYKGVWDNKDPLFYFGLAAGRAISPYADILIEVSWIVCAAFAVLLLARWRGCDRQTAWFVSFGMAPLIITGGFYVPGYTHLPGTALTLWVLVAAVSNRFGAAGALFGVLAFTKIVMLPIAFLVLVIVILVRRAWPGILLSAAGSAVTGGAVSGLLYFRGELQPYLNSLLFNVAYSQGTLVGGQEGPVIGHLLRVTSGAALLVGAVIVLILAWVLWAHKRSGTPVRPDKRSLILWVCVGSSLLGAVAVLGVSGLWCHHDQVLYIAAILASIGVVHRLQLVFNVRSAVPAAAFICLAVCLSGPVYPAGCSQSMLSVPQLLGQLGSISPEAEGVLSVGNQGTYARVGQNDDAGHAYGLGGWDLACPRFHQYPFDSAQDLNDVWECLPTAEVIIVSPSASPIAGDGTWNTYLGKVEATLHERYSCSQRGQGRICVRQTG